MPPVDSLQRVPNSGPFVPLKKFLAALTRARPLVPAGCYYHGVGTTVSGDLVLDFTRLVGALDAEVGIAHNGDQAACLLVTLDHKLGDDWTPWVREFRGVEVLWKVKGNHNAL